MNDLAIKVDNLSKQYRIGGPQERYRTFRDTIVNTVSSPFRKVRDLIGGTNTGAAGLTETIWALRDVSFEVKRGEVVGVIGRNGAGKTTLLKILSRITEPTEGSAEIYGRVGSLLEVGTGFHPELTGRENIYLNGAILGMKRAEIDHKFDEIVAFAEIEKFIDTPVKHYSSGMCVRLAFAVAAHLEPEILLVDEVLAVGDAAFQKKCVGKMAEVAKIGRTVLFVSHNTGAVREFCEKVLVLDNGEFSFIGSAALGVKEYLRRILYENDRKALSEGIGFGRLLIDGKEAGSIRSGSPFSIIVEIQSTIHVQSFELSVIMENLRGELIIDTSKANNELNLGPLEPGSYRLSLKFPALWIAPGAYSLYFKINVGALAGDKLIYRSDKFPVDAVGVSGKNSKAICAPGIVWGWSNKSGQLIQRNNNAQPE